MASNKVFIQRLVKICEEKRIKHVVFSPGSRNAPLVITFNENPTFSCITIPDERVAAFFAMGMAQQLQEPVIICCTSGSAALNYAPAIVEAYYQKIPLLVLTADRPVEWIDQGVGQTMRQKNVYTNYIKNSYELIQEATKTEDLLQNDIIINEAIHLTKQRPRGPVHVNVPLSEPLYDQVAKPQECQDLHLLEPKLSDHVIDQQEIQSLNEQWHRCHKKLIICGQGLPDPHLDRALETIAGDPAVVVISETCSNRRVRQINPCIDRLITTIEIHELEAFKPELVVSIGDAVISKKIKVLIKNYAPQEHWYINEQETAQDTFGCLTKHIKTTPLEFLSILSKDQLTSEFRNIWHDRHHATGLKHQEFLLTAPWSDLKVFDHILKQIPTQTNLQISNSSAIRYVQLFEQRFDIRYDCNRGVSGIDGCTSTAAGAAYVSKELTTLVTGDMAFLYDSNALWNHHLPSNLVIIIINNGGGGIFKIIPGPHSTKQYKQFFATEHQQTAKYIARAFDCTYFSASNEKELQKSLEIIFNSNFDRPPILEVMTQHVANEDVLHRYFDFIKINRSPTHSCD